jgi:hypothetical protein
LRHRVIRFACVLLAATALSVPIPHLLPVPRPNPAGRCEQVAGVRVVYLHGDAYEMGLQHGSLFRDQVRQLVRDYLYGHIVASSGCSHVGLLHYVRLLEPRLPRDLCRELQGIADGAGLSYQDVLLLNVLPDLIALTHQLPAWELSSSLSSTTGEHFVMAQSAEGADLGAAVALGSHFAAWGSATEDGDLIAGHNLYSLDAGLLQPHHLLIIRQPSHGSSFVSLGLAGMVGVWLGMNEDSLVVSLAGAPSVDVARQGQPMAFLLRQVLQNAGDLDEAESILLRGARLCGGSVILADGKAPEAMLIELSAHRQAIFEATPDSALLARTSNFLSPDLQVTQRDVFAGPEAECSEVRYARLLAMLQMNSAWISQEKGLAFLKDDQDTQAEGGHGLGNPRRSLRTLHSVLLYPGQLTLWVMQGQDGHSLPQSNGTDPPPGYVELDLTLSLSTRLASSFESLAQQIDTVSTP